MQIFSSQLLMASQDIHGTYEWTTPGNYSFKLSRRTKATIWIVGSGRNRYQTQYMSLWNGGGGGAAFIGGVILPAGTYTVSVGDNADTTLKVGEHTYINAGCGPMDLYNYPGSMQGGDLFLGSDLVVQVGTITLESDGNNATYNSSNYVTTGGASLYNGYGRGSDSNVSNYTTGYFKIEF